MAKLRIKKPKGWDPSKPPPPPKEVPPVPKTNRLTKGTRGKTRIPPPEERPPTNRLTVVEDMYHQSGHDEPEHFRGQFSRELSTQEQVYDRKESVGEGWLPLHLGWFTDKNIPCGLLYIKNLHGEQLQKIPTKAQKAEIASHVLELSFKPRDLPPNFGSEPWLIPPGESMRVYPSQIEGLVIRSQVGSTKFLVLCFPR